MNRHWKPEDIEDNIEYDPKSYKERLARLRERTDLHQDTLDKLRKLFDEKWTISIGNFDLMTEKADNILLHEVKTLRLGSKTDERLRIIDAIGKLFFYENIDVPQLQMNKRAKIQKMMVFNRKPVGSEHIHFLKKLGIWTIWFNKKGRLDGEKGAKRALLQLLR